MIVVFDIRLWNWADWVFAFIAVATVSSLVMSTCLLAAGALQRLLIKRKRGH